MAEPKTDNPVETQEDDRAIDYLLKRKGKLQPDSAFNRKLL